jgi:ACS family tartrate transporter-like MFS transporter
MNTAYSGGLAHPDVIVKKCARRIVPLALFGFFLCFLDRTNVGMASLSMNKDIGLTPAMYGFGAGLFFWGYCLFEVPSNMALARFGARIWIARIMVMWGAASLGMVWIKEPHAYYVLRFLLGVAEAGFVPGIIYYFRSWFPEQYNNRMIGLFLVSNPLAALIGNPLSGILLQLDGVLALRGWQWLFLIESVPTILFGILIFFRLPDSPRTSTWLEPAEREWLISTLDGERAARQGIKTESIWGVLFNPRIWALSSIYLGLMIGMYGVTFFLPQIVRGFGLSALEIGFVSGIPSLFGAVAMVLWSRHSDYTRERAWHTITGCVFTMTGLTLAAYAPTPTLSVLGLTLTSMGTLAGMVAFWSMPNILISGTQAAAAFGLVNTIGSFGGVVGPSIMGVLRESTGDFRVGLLGLAACQVIGICMTLYFRKEVNAARYARRNTAVADTGSNPSVASPRIR